MYNVHVHFQVSMELGPEDVSLLERCPHFRGYYVQALMELGPEDVSLLEGCVPPLESVNYTCTCTMHSVPYPYTHILP